MTLDRSWLPFTPSDLAFARFAAKVTIDRASGCWLWRGYIRTDGYAKIVIQNEQLLAHRVAYLWAHGELPPAGIVLDHLCRTRHCVNPLHLDPVTITENVFRGPAHNRNKTRCARGHDYSPENTYSYHGRRQCLACRAAYDRRLPKGMRYRNVASAEIV